MVTFSPYPADPRPRRAVEALVKEGMSVDLVCLLDDKSPKREKLNGIDVVRIPIAHRRGGKLSYFYNYSAFISLSAAILAIRTLKRRYDLAYVHNMPDVLVLSSLGPKAFGSKVILDMHDPMPELMTTIFNRNENSRAVRLLRRLEKWSMARADLVVTVNEACKRLFASRSCRAQKVAVVMNSPDEGIFRFREAHARPSGDASTRPFAIMYHGSLVERNGLDLGLDALARIRPTIPTAELRIYGKETPFLHHVLSESRNKGLQDSVRYLGPRRLEDLVPAIEDCDVGIIPNHRSAFSEINTPTRIFEYLALGKPVIAPRARGISDYFDDSSLVFFELGSGEDLARKLEYVFSHPAEAAEIVKRGQTVYQEHGWSAERERFIDLVAGILSGSRAGASCQAPL
jgi:glycosyltransferase involved in cell wall biosynthesis